MQFFLFRKLKRKKEKQSKKKVKLSSMKPSFYRGCGKKVQYGRRVVDHEVRLVL